MDSINILYKAFTEGATICTDTRAINSGCIFFALKGANFNGNKFASQALDQGAALAVVDEDPEATDTRYIRVNDVLSCLQQLALHHRKQLQIPFIAITGSNGKTTTKELVNRVLSKKYKTLCTRGNLNNHIGVPLTLLSVTLQHEIAIIEMGANHQKEIELLCSLALPTHVLITNVGKAHLEGFGGFDGVKKGKGEMYEFARAHQSVVFINGDNPHLTQMLGAYPNTVSYGTTTSCDLVGKLLPANVHVNLEWKAKDSNETYKVHSQITGDYNFENILSAISLGLYFGVPVESINNSIESYIPDNQRSQEIKLGNTNIILDAYNANPSSMEAALKNFSTGFTGKKAIFLGDMLELGATSAREHQTIIELARATNPELLILVGPNFKEAGQGIHALFFDNSADASRWCENQNFTDYTILIKGSRGSKMEVILEGIKITSDKV